MNEKEQLLTQQITSLKSIINLLRGALQDIYHITDFKERYPSSAKVIQEILSLTAEV